MAKLTTDCISLILALFFSSICFSASQFSHTVSHLEGIGYGTSPKQAEKIALASIINQINQLVSFNRCQLNDNDINRKYCTGFTFHFDLALQGIHFQAIKAGVGEFGQSAKINKIAIEQYYKQKHLTLVDEIKTAISTTKNNQALSKKLWLNSKEVEAYENLLSLFAIQTKSHLSKNTLDKIQDLQINHAQTINSLKEIPSILLSMGAIQNAFIHAPVPDGSIEMTPFSELIRHTIYEGLVKHFPNTTIEKRGMKVKRTCYDRVRNIQINCAANKLLVSKNNTQNTLLLGSYQSIPNNQILLHYALVKPNEGIIDFKFIKITKPLVAHIRRSPVNKDFDQKLHQNILPSSQFRSNLSSTKGKRNILLSGGEDFGLKIKLNHAGYFYLVGHILHEQEQYSYLVELDPNKRLFVGKITPPQINHWQVIGEFTIAPPYGVEHLQLITANYDLSDYLPETEWDDKLGYHVIKGSKNNAMKGLNTVRGMQRICSAQTTRGFQRNCGGRETISKLSSSKENTKELEHESVLSYTSLPISN